MRDTQVETGNRVGGDYQAEKKSVLSERDHLPVTRHVTTTAATLLPEGTV